jgi:hypothetical protein
VPAWPGRKSASPSAPPWILAECDFNAENFIVTDLVGGSAAWDGEDGRQQRLMDWSEIKALSRSGARFGSRLATHRYADGLSSRELVAEEVRSRAALEDVLQSDVISLPHLSASMNVSRGSPPPAATSCASPPGPASPGSETRP